MAPADDFTLSSTTKLIVTSKSLTLPTEIIYVIICFLDPLELMRLQTISKQFHAIANDPMLWRKMYSEARCARFPGPFPWQSTRFLQRTLVRSMKVEQTWTSQPLRVRVSSRRRVLCDLDFSCPHHWVSHRWFVFQRGMEIVSRDIETDSQQTLWNNGLVSYWSTCSIISVKGHMIYLIFRIGDGDQHDAVQLLEYRADDDSGRLAETAVFDVPVTCLEGHRYVGCKSSPGTPFVLAVVSSSSVDPNVVFDIRSQNFYKFPPFHSRLVELQPFLMSWSPFNVKIHLTTSHIIITSQFNLDEEGLEYAYLIQVFEFPDRPIPDDTAVGELRLSHEASGNGYWNPDFYPIQDSVVSRVDGPTTVRFIHLDWPPEHVVACCTKFSLPRSRGNAILPISIEMQELFRVKSFKGFFIDTIGLKWASLEDFSP